MSLPEYSICSVIDDGAIKYGVKWRGKFDPIAVCDDHRDAVKICDALNNPSRNCCGAVAVAWIPVVESMPDDDLCVLIHYGSTVTSATHGEGGWMTGDGDWVDTDQVTHWAELILPDEETTNQ